MIEWKNIPANNVAVYSVIIAHLVKMFRRVENVISRLLETEHKTQTEQVQKESQCNRANTCVDRGTLLSRSIPIL